MVLKVKNQQVVAVDVSRSYHPHPRPAQSYDKVQSWLTVLRFATHESVNLDPPDLNLVLRMLAVNTAAFRDEDEAAVLAVGPSAPTASSLARDLGCPFPFLIDQSGETAPRQGLATPALILADRFGEVWAAWSGGEAHALPSATEIRAWLELIEMQCPECGVPEWPATAQASGQ